MSLVEYHDPDGLFPLLSPQLLSYLPLRNLHWKSPARPLRSIAALHVNFVPCPEISDTADISSNGARPTSNEERQLSQSSALGYAETVIANDPNLAAKGRRHQIPGLHQTPYLKIYLLRCDDNETYKSTSRKLIREWMNTHGSPSKNSSIVNKQENHDAFEWLILHVVWPDTTAATQARWTRKSGGETEGSKEKSSSAPKWSGRSSSTILEKIRADFNHSSKSSPDRVAQIRLQKDAVPPYVTPWKPSTPASIYSESSHEQENAWNDLISKTKALILMSFTLRVNQYEEDVREKEAQRRLPGWNFCTFFVLKEGLARAFESVGLTEDALVGYDELSAGLDTILRDQMDEESETHGDTFLAFTQELHDQLISAKSLSDRSAEMQSDNTVLEKPLGSSRKDYRGKIVSNNISVFDFRCYLFSRQFSLLLNLCSLNPSQQSTTNSNSTTVAALMSSGQTKKLRSSVEDAISLADLCWRALQFIASTARIMRQDLLIGANAVSRSQAEKDTAINNMVHSWMYSVAQQILDDTTSSPLPGPALARESKTVEQLTRLDKMPNRSLSPVPSFLPHASSSGIIAHDNKSTSYNQSIKDVTAIKNTGLASVAAHRAELYLLQRRILEKAGEQCNLGVTPKLDTKQYANSSREISLINHEQKDSNQDLESKSAAHHMAGLENHHLRAAMSSVEIFRSLYQELSDRAAWQYQLAGREKSAERLIANLAALKYNEGDYAAAVAYFNKAVPGYGEQRWNSVEFSLLKTYAECLKVLNRKDEYVRLVLSLLSKAADAARSRLQHETSYKKSPFYRHTSSWINDAVVDVRGFFSDLVLYSEELPYDVSVPMSRYFDDIQVDHRIGLFEDRDGFQLSLSIRQLLADTLSIGVARVRLVHLGDGQSREIWLQSDKSVELGPSVSQILLTSNITIFGRFIVDKVTLKAGRIVFVHEALAKHDANTPLGLSSSVAASSLLAAKNSHVLCYPRAESFALEASMSKLVHIGQTRNIEVLLDSGSNQISKLDLIVRSASAGLRLQTSEAETMNHDLTIINNSAPGVISIGKINSDTTAELSIPYSVEHNVAQVSIRIEAQYTTIHGDFVFMLNATIGTGLAVDVNVQDIFKEKSLISKFWLRPVSGCPLHLLDVNLQSSEFLSVKPVMRSFLSMLAFPQQPACVSYMISRALPVASRGNLGPGKALPLTIEYRSMDDDVIGQIVTKLKHELRQSSFAHLLRLLILVVTDSLRIHISATVYENAALGGQIALPSFDELEWAESLGGLRKKVRQPLLEWLKKWHTDISNLSLETPDDPTYMDLHPSRRLIIDFEVPGVHFLHTASLQLLDQHGLPVTRPMLAAVGQIFAAELQVRHTRRWDFSLDPSTKPKSPSAESASDFMYEITANNDTWLVGGQKRAHFSAREDESVTFNLILIPLMGGEILLPSVEIKSVNSAHQMHPSDEEISSSMPNSVPAYANVATCETDYISQSETIFVIENMQSTTVGIGQDSQLSRGMTLLESKSRISIVTD